ncbi:MAG: hypothetical protein A2W91_16820 [Bacteroidetes bacterium GWF2_38_335]|nr:MAG: hypothetical protein A2W91_16820 [Bacteroidetes bacterium GWF2_38_335]OFY81348.1 MAG: hypothetical protein A2281_07795 [Bacteroidetes bacterium RIFOXYA12_FULL_38_20]HBS85470.1 hypothetical protein [Bacteroidales bacterium]
MIIDIIDWFNKLDVKIQVVLISSITSIIVLVLGWFFKGIYERNSLNYKLKKEFKFEQKKKLKAEIAKNKIPLLNAVEEFNHRIWNFSQNVGENWHKVPREGDQYYINSFIYRFLLIIHLTIKTERDTITIDSTIAEKSDILFLKYVKTFKDIFTDIDILRELGYDHRQNTNHFYKNDLIGYTKAVLSLNNERVMDFDDFKEKLDQNYLILKKVIHYFIDINADDYDKNLNVLRCYHIIGISFLNTFGHTYQKTSKKKFKKIFNDYEKKIKVKKGFELFIRKSKLGKEIKCFK